MMTVNEFLAEWHDESDRLLVHTSGSTGQPKPLWVEKRRMEASARITCRFLGLRAGQTALLCMPLDFIAGKMMVVRSEVCGLRLMAVEPSGHPLSTESLSRMERHYQPTKEGDTTPPHSDDTDYFGIDFAAMVPLQVYQSLQVPTERARLMAIGQLIVGGGAIDERLERELRHFPNDVWSTYGMTETLSHIALRRISGPTASPWYEPMEGVAVSLNAEGCLVIDAPAVCAERLTTNDMAAMHADGRRFRIIGRRDNVVCSGGLKIQIEEVEQRLRPHINAPFAASWRPDERLGQALVLVTEAHDLEALADVCRNTLPHHWQPQAIVHTDRLPMTATGKPARREIQSIAAQQR